MTPDLPAVASDDPALAGAAAQAVTTRFRRETAQRQERSDAVIDHRIEEIKRLIKGMPACFRSNMLEQPLEATFQELILARKQMIIRYICQNEVHP